MRARLRPAQLLVATVTAVAAAMVWVAAAAPPAQAATFTAGVTASTGSDDWGNQNGMSATQVTSGTTGGGLTRVSLYISAVNAAPLNHGSVAVYSDVNDLPGAKLAASGSQVLTAKAWNNFAVSGVGIAASTKYWLVFNVDGGNTKYRITSGGRAAWRIPTTYGVWPDSFGATTNGPNGERYAINMTWDSAITPPPTTTTAPPPTTTTTAAPPTTTTTTTTAVPPPSGTWPDASNTGVPAGTTLSTYTGPCTITAANTVIDAKTLNCDLTVHAANVQVTRSKINGQVWLDTDLAGSDTWSATITDSEVDAGPRDLPGVCCGNVTVLRSNLHGGHNGAQCDGGTVCTIQDSWLHAPYNPSNFDSHLGGFLTDGVAKNIKLIHNRIACDAPANNVGGGCTGDVNLIPNFGPVSGVLIQNNLFGANTGSAYCTFGGEKSTSPYPHADHVVYQDNVFERGTNGRCADYGPVTDFNPNGVGNQWVNNTWSDAGPVSPV
jgi:hypothetical protein